MTHRPILTHTRDQLAEALARLPGTKALVMTMGALHAGHLQLVREAHALADHVIVTIFVNPTQFAPGEDFDAYPRTLGADMDALETVGADLVWAPSPQDVYPAPATVSIDPGPVARVLEGKTRPTHFAGVALVCTKVVNLVRPDVALYGQKDAQQLAVLRTVFSQLDIPVRVHAVPIVRDRDGVALSSRNHYLSEEERVRARALSRALRRGVEVAEAGAEPGSVISACRAVIDAEDGIDLDYIALVDAGTFEILAGTDGVPLGEAEAAPTLLTDGSRAGRVLRQGRQYPPHRQHGGGVARPCAARGGRGPSGRCIGGDGGARMMEMTREMAIGKIHRATVTGADLHYVGSITVDEDLLDAANIVPGQKVDVADVNNGERLSTYTIAGERGSGTVQLNGAAAHRVRVGDLVIIMAYAQVPESLVRQVKPSVVFVDEANAIVEAGDCPGRVPEDSARARELGLKSSGA